MIRRRDKKRYELVAKWIHGESSEPISEIEFLLKSSYGKVEELEEAYIDVIKKGKNA